LSWNQLTVKVEKYCLKLSFAVFLQLQTQKSPQGLRHAGFQDFIG
jgi:hypothetical protein